MPSWLKEIEVVKRELQEVRRQLSQSERQVAELVASGRSNHEVGERLLLSPKTVEWLLTKVYRKLGVRSRTELAARLQPELKRDGRGK
jgi:DNA-binding CsgD family transcriptional regulator